MLSDAGANPSLRGIMLHCWLREKVSAYADNVTVFLSRPVDIDVVKQALARYKKVSRTKINLEKNDKQQLGAWRDGIPLPGLFCLSDDPIRILKV